MDETAKILVIEDDKFLNKLYSDQLRREGFEVSVAISGEEGLSKALNENPDLVILDIVLPHKNGFDILSEMKLRRQTKNIPVVILTNLEQDTDIKTGLDLGAAGYLIKTDFPITKLGEEVRKYLVINSKLSYKGKKRSSARAL